MPINPETLLNWPFAELEHSYTERDTVLYANWLGCDADSGRRHSTDAAWAAFVFFERMSTRWRRRWLFCRNRFHLLRLTLLEEPAAKSTFDMVLVVFALGRLIKAAGLVNIFA